MNLRAYLIDWLNSHPGQALEKLAEMGIRVANDPRYPDLYCLKYGVVVEDKAAPLVRACRGAIVERSCNSFSLKAYSFDRFFNIGEHGCDAINWDTAKIFHKYDGSLTRLFYYRGKWIVATSGSVAGGSRVGACDITFEQLFWKVFNEVGYNMTSLDPQLCYTFELCHRWNKVVVYYAEPQLPLLTVRDIDNNFEELDIASFSDRFHIAKSYDFKDSDELLQNAKGLGADQEGYIVYDGVGRCKVKSDLYIQLHAAVNNQSPRFSELFLSDNLDEFLLHFPEYREDFSHLTDTLSRYETETQAFLAENSDLTQKEFAIKLLAEKPYISPICFVLRSGKFASFNDWLASQTPQSLDKLLGL